MTDQDRCKFCGAYLIDKPLYSLRRKQGNLEVKLCRKCGSRNKIWKKN